jgi:hypothetical protein
MKQPTTESETHGTTANATLGSRRGGASKITDSRPRRLQRSLQQPHEPPPPLARPEPRRRRTTASAQLVVESEGTGGRPREVRWPVAGEIEVGWPGEGGCGGGGGILGVPRGGARGAVGVGGRHRRAGSLVLVRGRGTARIR